MREHQLTEQPQYPAGPFAPDTMHNDRRREVWIAEVGHAPARLRASIVGLSEAVLEAKYRNWTIRQIAHHVADSHLNSYVRFKLALTEERPTIKPHDESRWSMPPDAQRGSVDASLQLLSTNRIYSPSACQLTISEEGAEVVCGAGDHLGQ